MLYFAYGSNMHSAQMKERCPAATFVCLAKLPSHRLAFTLKSFKRGCGVADVLYDEAKEVWGVVYKLPEDEVTDLDKDESFQPGRPDDQNEYTREKHYVWPEGDSERALLVALYRGHPQLDPPLPSDDYNGLSSRVPGTGTFPQSTFANSNLFRRRLERASIDRERTPDESLVIRLNR